MEEQPLKICPFCQSPIVEKKGISRKTGQPYRFWGCSNYPDCKYIWHPTQPKTEVQRGDTEQDWIKGIPVTQDDLKQLWDEIETIKRRLDRLADYNKQLAEGKTTEPYIED